MGTATVDSKLGVVLAGVVSGRDGVESESKAGSGDGDGLTSKPSLMNG